MHTRMLGLDGTNLTDKWLSVLGVGIAMSALVGISALITNPAPWFIIASMGASAIILFATPHVAMAQPWALIMGQLVAGVCGLASWNWITDPMIAVVVAVTATALLMVLLNCRHAPGGATALFIALGGVEVERLGWSMLWLSVLPGVLTLFTVAVVFNAPFSWRRYPLAWFNNTNQTNNNDKINPQISPTPQCEINHEDLVFASRQLNGFFDMNEAEFMQLYRAARQHHKMNAQLAEQSTRPGAESKRQKSYNKSR